MNNLNLKTLGWTPAHDFYLSETNRESWLPGRVSRVDRGRALVITPEGENPAVWPSKIPAADDKPVETPVIGDWCLVSPHQGLHRIEMILPRATRIARSVAGGGRAVQVLAANVDVVFIVTGLDLDFNLRRIERYLALSRAGGVRPVIVLNKADLCDDADRHGKEVERIAPGITVRCVSALDPGAADVLRGELGFGKTAVFLGSSGAGKSTLINALLEEPRQATAPVRAGDDRGRHITSRRELFALPGGGAVIDTPGLREVGVLIDEESLKEAFQDIADLAAACRYQDCRHGDEPGGAVREAVRSGDLDGARLASFLKLRAEAENAALRQSAYAHREQERRTIGKYRKWLKEVYRFKGRS